MPLHRQTRRLCLCSRCAKKTHQIDGHHCPGQLLTYDTARQHQVKDRIAPQSRNALQPIANRTQLPSQSQVVSSPSKRVSSSSLLVLDRHPAVIHVMVSAVVLFLFKQVPIRAVECQLRSNFELITPFLLQTLVDPPITPAAISKLPRKINTVMSALGLNSHINQLVACPACFATYPIDGAPPLCTSTLTDELPGHPASCGTPIFITKVPKPVPCRQYSFQSLPSWLSVFLSRPGIEDLLDQSLVLSREDYNPNFVSDIHQSLQWKEFRGIDGKQFTAQSGNLSFGMFIDGINPYGNKQAGKHASITFIVLVCLTLPIAHRFLPQNIYLVGIAPGPKEPSLTQTNWLLDPLVQDLTTLWRPGLSLPSTYRHPRGRHIQCALMPFFADLPACRRTLGLAGHASHNHMCSKCHLTKNRIQSLDINLYRKRSDQHHRKLALQARDADSYTDRQRIYKTEGIRYSKFSESDYWSLINDHVIDPMHNLLLGTLAWHCRRFWKMTDPENIQSAPVSGEVMHLIIDSRHPPQRRAQTPSDHEENEESAGENQSNADDNILDNNLNGDDTNFMDISFQSTDPDDSDYLVPEGELEVPISATIFDSHLLAYVNQRLTRIHIPTSVSRAIPILGSASYGKLKADEWCHLFTIQLPLCLIPLWNGKDEFKQSLLANFCHLVSMVNIALKRTMSSDRIAKYRLHNRAYLESAVKLFPDSPLAPNHHMSLHIPECLERFGPVRAWWSFPFERFMGQVVKSCHNNRIGQLETTFLNTFTRASRLCALLEQNDLPDSLSPLIASVMHTESAPPDPFSAITSLSYQPCLSDHALHLLVEQINRLGPQNHITSDQYHLLPRAHRNAYYPIQ
ncbi:hypothetical protein MJO28_016832 [Puccinia striiformis f. sp. tritici]|uniref:DUF4218 domain-containing protein n=1 Tax=Puccinia striiformis TaxID=27350 RepID=A0A2S4UA43_9BASI|nr:hypothetical protein MJO28_016832 [Puccinia striiformis f. sp. tritici]POV94096.1 hypothetical protein PSTT_17031 [Puccinia striiformis]